MIDSHDIDLNEVGGAALVVGFLLVALMLYRTPASGFETATANIRSVLYFLVIPLLGLFAGVYTYVGGAYGAVPLFLLGSYLGVFGVGLTFGGLLSQAPVGLPVAVGVASFLLAMVALVSSLLGLVASFRVNASDSPPD